MSSIDYIVIILFLVSMLVIGFIAKGQVKDMDDFILGGKRFNKFALTGTILATMMGSGMTMGAVGSVYTSGFGGSMVWIYGGVCHRPYRTGLYEQEYQGDRRQKFG